MKRILVVDDGTDFAQLVQYHLQDVGYEFEVATRGVRGLKKARRHQPDVILMDLLLPNLDGLTLCEILRRLGLHDRACREQVADEEILRAGQVERVGAGAGKPRWTAKGILIRIWGMNDEHKAWTMNGRESLSFRTFSS